MIIQWLVSHSEVRDLGYQAVSGHRYRPLKRKFSRSKFLPNDWIKELSAKNSNRLLGDILIISKTASWHFGNFVDNWQTPMLVVTGEKDFRVPYTQGIGAFTALQERGIPSQLLVFPDENHWVLKPANSLQWHDTVFAWLDRWLGEDAE